MKHSKEAQKYLESEHIRLMTKVGEREVVPTLEERILAAFDAGMARASKTYSNLDLIASEKCNINFPKWNE